MRVEHDRHLEGVFPRADWLSWLEQEGFHASPMIIEHSEAGRLELFAGRKG